MNEAELQDCRAHHRLGGERLSQTALEVPVGGRQLSRTLEPDLS